MILLVNACVTEDSRTLRLASRLLEKLDGEVTEINLSKESFPVVDAAFLKKRDKLIEEKKWDDPLFAMARLFAEADRIVIAAPYYDLSFPASLKQFFEQINVLGITFEYSPEGFPVPLCKAERLYYVTTAGGAFVPEEYGFGYVKALAENFYGIKDVRQLKAVGLDIYGADIEGIMEKAFEECDRIV